MRKIIAAPIVAGLIGMAALAAPLAETPTTSDVNGGSISVTAPTDSVSLGSTPSARVHITSLASLARSA
jgi:hypothetical protein